MAYGDKKVRIASDYFNEFTGGLGYFGEEAIPVDMNGHRVWATKKDSNQKEAAEDIKDLYGLQGNRGFSEKR